MVNKRDNTGKTNTYCSEGYGEPRAGGEREREVPNFQYADWRYSEATNTQTAELGRRNSQMADSQDCDRSGLQNTGVGDTTSMLQDTRLQNRRTVQDSHCRRLWKKINYSTR